MTATFNIEEAESELSKALSVLRHKLEAFSAVLDSVERDEWSEEFRFCVTDLVRRFARLVAQIEQLHDDLQTARDVKSAPVKARVPNVRSKTRKRHRKGGAR
jgi:hypothetical protein